MYRLHKECLPQKGWKILYGLNEVLKKYRVTLAGGTALALHLGHRISIDLNFFTDFNFKVESIISEIRKKGTSLTYFLYYRICHFIRLLNIWLGALEKKG